MNGLRFFFDALSFSSLSTTIVALAQQLLELVSPPIDLEIRIDATLNVEPIEYQQRIDSGFLYCREQFLDRAAIECERIEQSECDRQRNRGVCFDREGARNSIESIVDTGIGRDECETRRAQCYPIGFLRNVRLMRWWDIEDDRLSTTVGTLHTDFYLPE